MSYRTDTRALVLAVLSHGPKHGYAISKSIKELSRDVLKLGEGQLYPVLHALEEQKWVEAEWQHQEGDPPKKVYSITDSGVAELEKRSSSWAAFAAAVAQILPHPTKREAAHE